ncbi:MAG: hypothetical protein H8D97_01510 [Proteobacteria bacterium]|nr:hypothetical protein [Pseudomonadota bacterium]
MSILNWILFVWLSMALIKLIIMLGTVIDGIAKFGNPESNIIMLIRSFLLGALVSVAITITVWPYQ